jgi:hypothetical protein
VQSWLESRDGTDLWAVRYEDLLQDTQRELERMVRFVGLSSTPDTLDHAVRASGFDQMRKLEETQGRPYGDSAHQFVRRGTAGQWKSQFDEECKAIFKSRANDLLREIGYVNTADW